MVTKQIRWEPSGLGESPESFYEEEWGCVPTGSGSIGQGWLDRILPFGPDQKLSVLSLGILKNAGSNST